MAREAVLTSIRHGSGGFFIAVSFGSNCGTFLSWSAHEQEDAAGREDEERPDRGGRHRRHREALSSPGGFQEMMPVTAEVPVTVARAGS